MKFQVLAVLGIFLALTSAKIANDTEIVKISLDVPSDINSWVFNGKNNTDRSNGRGGRISTGYQAHNTQFPWVVELSINTENGGLYCTGSLISTTWIVSARHCLADFKLTSVVANMGSADREANRVKIFINKIVFLNSASGNDHPDIALLQLSMAVGITSNIKTIRLPRRYQDDDTFEGETITAIGWGGIAGSGYTRYLQYGEFRILPLSQCDFGLYFCSQAPNGVTSLEGGDSGGPTIIDDFGTPTLLGINVFYVDSRPRLQGSTKINKFLNFICDVTGIPMRYY